MSFDVGTFIMQRKGIDVPFVIWQYFELAAMVRNSAQANLEKCLKELRDLILRQAQDK